jgi:positive regulator of sigma E activity
MIETGQVVDVFVGRVDVRLADAGHADRCGRCGLCAQRRDGTLVLTVPLTADQRGRVAAGQQVAVEVDEPSPYRAILLLFVLPLAGLLAGAAVGQHWGVGVAALLAVGGLGAGVGLGLAVERLAGGRRRAPRLVLPPEEE